MKKFQIEFLDHVAIRVKDMKVSAAWYEKVIGLKKYIIPQWDPYPVFLLSGKSGVALFPAKLEDPDLPFDSKNTKIDHFAFNVTGDNFEKAISWYDELGLDYEIKNHELFLSLYTRDPDGHIVELTTINVEENTFYK